MTTGTNDIVASFSPNDTIEEITTFSPSTGELYYVGDLRVIADSDISDSRYGAVLSIFPEEVSPSGSTEADNGVHPTSATTPSTGFDSATTSVGAYLSDEETIHVWEESDTLGGDNGTVYVMVELRRVI